MGRLFLILDSFLSSTYIYLATIFWFAEFLLKNQFISLRGVPLYVICCFSLINFNIFSLYLIFLSLIKINNNFQFMFPLGFIQYGCFVLPQLECFLSHIREILSYNLKYFLWPFLCLSCPSGAPYNVNVGMINVVSEVS